MKNNLVSVLITNYNKGKFLKNSIKSILNQTYINKEVLLFDDCSKDNSLIILSKYKNITIIRNKNKKYESGPLNQIYGLEKLFKLSKGKIIYLLDGDDMFKKTKLSEISKFFEKNNKINFLQDTPLYSNYRDKIILKKKKHLFSIWPSFFPTSCIAIRRNFFLNFLKFSRKKHFPNLEIDARLSIYAYLHNQFLISNKSLTIYNYDENGISSKYKKFTKNWWKKRSEAFDYMLFVSRKLNKKFYFGPDFFITKIINYFI